MVHRVSKRLGFFTAAPSMAALAASFLAIGCTVGAPAQGLPYDDEPRAAPTLKTAEIMGPEASSDGPFVDACKGLPVDASRADQVCAAWNCAQRDLGVVAWTGSTSACSPGVIDQRARQRALDLVNVYRFLADVPPVVSESTWEPAAQQCALVAHANAHLSHSPAASSRCFSSLGAKASAAGLLANRSAPFAIGPFIADPGNETTMAHRRWLLQEELPAIGIGSTDRYSCIVVDGSSIGTKLEGQLAPVARGWVAWPPAGPVPFGAFASDEVDTYGWTIQSSDADLTLASVEVRRDGELVPVKTSGLSPLHGSLSAVRFVPDGWTTEPGHHYDVHVKALSITIDYRVEPIGCR